jgi:hypothetical protein
MAFLGFGLPRFAGATLPFLAWLRPGARPIRAVVRADARVPGRCPAASSAFGRRVARGNRQHHQRPRGPVIAPAEALQRRLGAVEGISQIALPAPGGVSADPAVGSGSATTPSSAISSSRQRPASAASTSRSSVAPATSSVSGRKQWPSSLACDSANCRPALTRSGLSSRPCWAVSTRLPGRPISWGSGQPSSTQTIERKEGAKQLLLASV